MSCQYEQNLNQYLFSVMNYYIYFEVKKLFKKIISKIIFFEDQLYFLGCHMSMLTINLNFELIMTLFKQT